MMMMMMMMTWVCNNLDCGKIRETLSVNLFCQPTTRRSDCWRRCNIQWYAMLVQ